MSTRILCVNAGSSTLKLALFEDDVRVAQVVLPRVDRLADAWRDLTWPTPAVVVHRFVHGGDWCTGPTWVTPATRAKLQTLSVLAPLHLPAALALLDASRTHFPDARQLICFDTSFHADLPTVARRVPLPARFGLRRYGFHGLSYEHVTTTLGAQLGPRAIVAHLGSGASLVALANGRPVDTTMGISPAGGIPMATRPGDLDPGALLHLLRQEGLSPAELERVVFHESGLRGVAGRSEMIELLAARKTDAAARDAVAMFVAGVQKAIGAYAALLGGLDGLAFTGGIGEHAVEIRAEICAPLRFLGVELDPERNLRSEPSIGAGAVGVYVVPAEEDRSMVRAARSMLGAKA